MSNNLYDGKAKSYYGCARPEMIPFIPSTVRNVLEIGCGRGEFMALLKQRTATIATGIEIFPEAAEAAKQHFQTVYCGDLASTLPLLTGEKFDCIILNDVLEHLVNPWEALRSIRPILSEEGIVVTSIPNIRYWPILNRLLLNGEWRYVDSGILDRTHLRFFTRSSIIDLFQSTGFTVKDIQGINPTKLWFKISLLNRLMRGRLNDAQYPQFATVAALNA